MLRLPRLEQVTQTGQDGSAGTALACLMPQHSCPGKSGFLYHIPVCFRQDHSKIRRVCFNLLVPVKKNFSSRFVCKL